MARGKFLTDSERDAIFSMSRSGFSIRKIAEALKRSVGAIQGVITSPEKLQRPKRSGTPRKVTERQKRHVVRCLSRGNLTAKQVKSKLNLDCSVRTV